MELVWKSMTLALTAIGIVLISNIVIGTVLMISVFGLMERNIAFGAAGGLIVGAGIIYAELLVGEMLFDLLYQEIRLLIVIAAIGAVVGVIGSVLTVKPEI